MRISHQGLAVKSGGWTQADVRDRMKHLDKNADGKIDGNELAAYADDGRAAGFADADALKLFRAGLDAGGLADQKRGEKGAQLSSSYIDQSMKPTLRKSYGAAGDEAADVVARQASTELTPDAARRFDDTSRLTGQHERGAIEAFKSENPGAVYIDADGNGQITRADRFLLPDGNGGFRRAELGPSRADQLRGNAGLLRATETFGDPGKAPRFPEFGNPNSPTGTKNAARWLGGSSHDEGGSWQLKDGKDGTLQWSLDTSRRTASQALDDIRKSPKSNVMDCQMARQVIQAERLRAQLGDAEFNKLAEKEGFVIGMGGKKAMGGMLKSVSTESFSGTGPDHAKAGQQGYASIGIMGRPDLQPALRDAGWNGEHFTAYTDEKGEKRMLAHPFGSVPAKDFEPKLKQRVVDWAAENGVAITPDDVSVSYLDPLNDVDTDKARRLARM